MTERPSDAPIETPLVRGRRAQRKRTPVETLIRVTFWVGLVIGSLGLLGVAGATSLKTDAGRTWLARRIESALNDRIRGRMAIGAISEVDGFGAHFRDVRFRSPYGAEFIRLERAFVRIRPWPLLRGAIVFEDVRIRGALVRIAEGRDEGTTLEDGFADAPGSGGDALLSWDSFDTRTMNLTGGSLLVTMGSPSVRVERISGFVRVALSPDNPVRVELDRMRGTWHGPGADLLGAPRFRATGLVRAKHDPVLRLRGRVCLDPPMPFSLRLGSGGAKVQLDADGHSLLGRAIKMVGDLVSDLEIELVDGRAPGRDGEC